jgi:hypothetical protein
LRLTLFKVSDDGPIAAVNWAAITDFETGELASAGVAGDELMQALLKHAPTGEMYFRPVSGYVWSDSNERKKDSVTRDAPAALNGNYGLEDDDRLTVGVPSYTR